MKLDNLHTEILGKQFEYYDEINSTQKEIWKRINCNQIENGTVICAGVQTNGIGTHGRVWHTDEKNNIAFSFFINANTDVKNLDGITIEIARMILQVFKNLYNIELQIKEPNDIVYDNKKIGGILTETNLVGSLVKNLVIGIGINTNQLYFSDDIKEIATSIKEKFGIEIDNELVISEICNLFEKEYFKRIGKKV